MKSTDKILVHLATNFVARVEERKMGTALAGLQMKQLRNEYMIEFFTGAYVAFRVSGNDEAARAIGEYTRDVLAPMGYERCQLLAKGVL